MQGAGAVHMRRGKSDPRFEGVEDTGAVTV